MKRTVSMLVIVVAAALVGSGLTWRKRANLLLQRARGDLQVSRGCSVFTPSIFTDEEMFEAARKQVHEVQRDGLLALYATPIGHLWYRVGAWTLPALVEEVQRDAYRLGFSIKPGNIVMDIGANVGATARIALASGASVVVAVEPDPTALECLRRNLADSIREKRVVVEQEGAWNQEETLPLSIGGSDAGGSSLVFHRGHQSIPVHVTTIDHIVSKLNLPRIDVIKIHVEGAERQAIEGATETIRRYHPQIAVALEHNVSDAEEIPAIVQRIWAGYHVSLAPCSKTLDTITPKAALLHQ